METFVAFPLFERCQKPFKMQIWNFARHAQWMYRLSKAIQVIEGAVLGPASYKYPSFH